MKKQKIQIGILFLFSTVFYLMSCAVLSHSQLKNINSFAVAAKNYSYFPGDVVRKSQELHYNNQILETSALQDSTQIIEQLERERTEFEKGIVFANKIDYSVQLIQKYAMLLAHLSSDSSTDNFDQSIKTLGDNLKTAINSFNEKAETPIPGFVGKSLKQVIKITTDRVIKSKKTKALKKIIPIGDTLIQITKSNLVSALDNDLRPLINLYKETYISDFQEIIFSHPSKINYNIIRFYVTTKSDYDSVEKLRKRCIRLLVKLAAAHNQLKENVRRKENLKELLNETKDFINDTEK